MTTPSLIAHRIAVQPNSAASIHSVSAQNITGQALYQQASQSQYPYDLIKKQFGQSTQSQKTKVADEFVNAAGQEGLNQLAATPDGQHALAVVYDHAGDDTRHFMQQVHEEHGNTAVDYTNKEGGEGLDNKSFVKYDMETFGTVMTEEKMSLVTNDPVKIANALDASIISRNDALGLSPTGSDTREINLGEQPVEVNIETNKLLSVRTGDEIFSRKVVVTELTEDAGVVRGAIILEPDQEQEVSTLVNLKESLKGELIDLQHARKNIEVDPRKKQPILVYAAEFGLEVKDTDFSIRLKASNVSSLTGTVGKGQLGVDTKGRIETKFGDVAKAKVPVINDNSNSRIDLGPFATENGAILIGAKLPKHLVPPTPVGSVTAKAEVGVNVLEFAYQATEPVRVGVSKIELLLSLTHEISDKQFEIDNLQTQIDHFEPQLKPVRINYKVPD
ncbi:MAG: hypothetical protein ABW124_19640 [Candidatus Thiodiazotropha sp. 6PLUC9]